MKVLLLGDYSSLHKGLREGLLTFPDMQVDLFSNGDGWKKIGGATGTIPARDINSIMDRFSLYFDQLKFCNGIGKYDVIQLINPFILSPVLNKYLYKCLLKRAKCVSLVACGGDYRLAESYLNGCFKYAPEDYDGKWLAAYDRNSFRGRMNIDNEVWLEKHVNVIVPTLYEYSVGYKGQNVSDAIPFPINVDLISYSENIIHEKVVFFHGLNNEAKKGTPFIRNAMERLVNDYPDDVEIIIKGHMPYDEYVQVMRRANVVIDQCLTSAYGINGCIAMAQGKVLMAGNTEDFRRTMKVDDCPIVHIEPDSEQIYSQMVKLVKEKDKIQALGKKSREFAEKNHDYKKVAERYLDVWRCAGMTDDK